MRAKVLRAYRDGATVEEIADRFDLKEYEVLEHLGRSGITYDEVNGE